jgi:uncharacterized protein YbjT (DUF2867 family)
VTKLNFKSWESALARHSDAAKTFSTTAAAIGDGSWLVPLGDGKWSPAQVTEHLNRTYEVLLGELNGGKGIRIRSSWLLRQVLRQTILRSIYRKRALPRGARAPSEIFPKVIDETQSAALERFATLALKFEEAMNANRDTGRKLTHQVFGEIELLPGLDFVAIHIEHHHRQIAS